MNNIEITNDQQAEAAREYLEIVDKAKEIQKILNLGTWVDTAKMQAALRAYEERKAVKDIVLSEDAMIVLQQKNIANDYPRFRKACTELRDNSLITRNASEVINDLGRAYLAQKPREIRVGDKVKILAKPCRLSDYAELIGKTGEVVMIGDKLNDHEGEIDVKGDGFQWWFFKTDLIREVR